MSERVADDDLRRNQVEPREIGVNPIERGVAEGEAVDADEALFRVPEHRGDEARSVEHADLDVCLPRAEAARSEIEKREVVLTGEILDVVGDWREPTIAGVLRVRVVVEEARKLREEAAGVHGATGGSSRRPGSARRTAARTTSTRTARRRGRARTSKA